MTINIVLVALFFIVVSFAAGYFIGKGAAPAPQPTDSGNSNRLDHELKRQLETATQTISTLTEERDQALAQLEDIQDMGKTPILGSMTAEEKHDLYVNLMLDPDFRREAAIKASSQPVWQEIERERGYEEANDLLSELFGKLDLDADARKSILDTWTASAMKVKDLNHQTSGSLSEEERVELRNKFGDVKSDAEEKYQALLGDDYGTFVTYRETADERKQLRDFSQTWAEPIDDYVKEALIQIMAEERLALGRPPIVSANNQKEVVNYYKESFELEKRRDANILKRSSSYLTEGQVEDLEKSFMASHMKTQRGIDVMEAGTAAYSQ